MRLGIERLFEKFELDPTYMVQKLDDNGSEIECIILKASELNFLGIPYLSGNNRIDIDCTINYKLTY